MKSDNAYYNKNLRLLANKLRKEMTKAEASLWKYVLKSKNMKGYQFRRQRPVLNYIADFMCRELRLVIEIDGITHDFEETIVKDEKKDHDLAAIGMRVLRFMDDDVLKNLEGVARRIEEVIEEIEASSRTPITLRIPGPPPAPPPAGDKRQP